MVNTKSIATIIIILISTGFFLVNIATISTLFTAQTYTFIRTPQEVYSLQPVFVFVYAPNVSTVKLNTNILIEINVSDRFISPPQTPLIQALIPSTRIPWAPDWFLASIPALPSKTINLSIRTPLGSVNVTASITSKVYYQIIADTSIIGSDSYSVRPREISRETPPLTYAFVEETLSKREIATRTLGLGPDGWVASSEMSVSVIVLAIDDRDYPEIELEYSVSGGSWLRAQLTDLDMMQSLYDLKNRVDNAISVIENWLKQYTDTSLPRSKICFRIARGLIPPQQAGEYIMFRSTARDIDNNTIQSPEGLYYVVNRHSSTKILVLDPHVWLWLARENMRRLTETIDLYKRYEIPKEVSAPIDRAKNLSIVLSEHAITLFHNWHYIGRYYDLYIAYPSSYVGEIFNSYKPSVIILSNLILGLQNSTILNWDLKDLKSNGLALIDVLIDYVKKNHAGVIVTHGTLSDLVVWLDCDERYKVGARGHVGSGLEDVNMLNEKSIAALLGMSELALWEFTRDTIAYGLCKSPFPYNELGLLIGSTPLQLSHIPWNGSLRITREARDLGWNISETMNITIPILLREYGFNAYTSIGWQLALPRAIAYVAWDKAEEARENFKKLRDSISQLVSNLTNNSIDATTLARYLDNAISGEIRDLYKALVNSLISDNIVNLSLPTPDRSKLLNLSISISRDVILNLSQKLPVKIVALSPDALAGIIVHDKFWDLNGYRSVYFSFEIEAAEGATAEKLLVNAIEWVKNWSYRDALEILRDTILVPRDLASRYRELLNKTPGSEIFSRELLANEEGATRINTKLESTGVLHLILVHPTTDKLVLEVVGERIKITNISAADRITYARITVEKTGDIEISVRAESDSPLNPVYITAKLETSPATQTTTITITETVTSVREVTHITTQTVSQISTVTHSTTITSKATETIERTFTNTLPLILTTTVKEIETIARVITTTAPQSITVSQTLTHIATTSITMIRETIPAMTLMGVIGAVIIMIALATLIILRGRKR